MERNSPLDFSFLCRQLARFGTELQYYVIYLMHTDARDLGLTCHALYPPDGIGHGKPRVWRSTQALGWRRSGCSARMCGTAGR